MRQLYKTLCICLAMTFFLSGCLVSVNPKSPTDKTPVTREGNRHVFEKVITAPPLQTESSGKADINLKIGFLFIGLPEDYGFTYAQNQGRLALIDALGVETMVEENVPEDERSLDAIQKLIDGGCTVIFACSYGFMDYTEQMAKRYPYLYFFHCSGNKTSENMSTYFGRMYQIRYLTGIVAGLRTETDKIGYVAAFPIPEVIRGADAFALGVKSVNPNAKVYLKWSNTWYDPGLEKELALELISDGCDVLAQHQDTILPQIAAEENGVWSIGYNSPMGFFAENAYLSGAIWNWGPYMIDQVKKIDAGTWEASAYWGGIEDDVVRLDSLTANVAPGTKEAVAKGVAAIKGGFDVFEGPIYDNAGTLRVPAGSVLSDEEKLSMDWLTDNIVGQIE